MTGGAGRDTSTAASLTRGAGVWGSAGLRLAALSGFLVLLTMLAALAVVYMQVSLVLHRNVDRQLVLSQQRLLALYATQGPDAAAQAIGQMLHDGRDTDSELALLTTPGGAFRAGNIDLETLPSLPAANSTMQLLSIGGQGVSAQVVAHRLPDGALLVLGYDLRELRGIESMVATASLVAGLFALALAAVGTLLFRRELARSVDAIHQTITRIADGQMSERVPVQAPSPGDEFARLEQDFNHMLDRIAQLMEGVRNVSDSIAHNLRTPLTRLRLRLQAAHDGPAGADELRNAMDAAMRDIEDLGRVLEKLLSIAQAEAGARRAPFGATTWNTIATEVVELYEDLAEHEGVALHWQPGPDTPVQGDHSLLAGALVNVVDNAIKYAGHGATVRVFIHEHAGEPARSEVVVQDNGPGAPASAVATLGERFVRLRPDLPGHGLGLASVRATLLLHGGGMRIEAAQPGLRVVLSLPVQGH